VEDILLKIEERRKILLEKKKEILKRKC